MSNLYTYNNVTSAFNTIVNNILDTKENLTTISGNVEKINPDIITSGTLVTKNNNKSIINPIYTQEIWNDIEINNDIINLNCNN